MKIFLQFTIHNLQFTMHNFFVHFGGIFATAYQNKFYSLIVPLFRP